MWRLTALLALTLAAGGGGSARPQAPITCRSNALLRPLCPREMTGARGEGFTCSARPIVAAFRHDRCPVVAWSYELPHGLRVNVAASRRGRVTDVTGVTARERRTRTVRLGARRWGTKRGRLVLVAPHRLFFYIAPRFAGDTSYAIALDVSRRPLARAVAALKAIVAS